MEKNGLYFSDLRIWNVLVNKSGKASIIDFGAITAEKTFLPFNTFITFMFQVISKTLPAFPSIISSYRSLENYESPYKEIVSSITSLTDEELSYAKILEFFESPINADNIDIEKINRNNNTAFERIMNHKFDVLDIYVNSMCVNHIISYLNRFENGYTNMNNTLNKITSVLRSQNTCINSMVAENKELKDRLAELEKQMDLKQNSEPTE